MFDNQHYLTKGVQTEIPFALQIFMWSCIDKLPEERGYFQVFKLENLSGIQKMTHFSERPEYYREYFIPFDKAVTAKVYVIDSKEYNTMLLAEEY